MTFANKMDSFNYWNTRSKNECEKRATEIKGIIETDPEADLMALKIEMDGIREALTNMQEKETETEVDETLRSLNVLTKAELRSNPLPSEPVASTEYRNAFFKNLKGDQLTSREQKVFNEVRSLFNSTENTGDVVPEQTLNEIIRIAQYEGGLISVVRSFNIPAHVALPVGTPNDKARWHTEGEEVDTEKIDVTRITFDGHELMKIFSLSNKLRTMSIPAFESYLTQELANCMLQTLADCIVNGTGVNQGTGVLTGINWNESNSIKTNNELSYKDIVKAISMLKRGYYNNAMFFMNNRTFYNSIYGMVDGNKRPIFVADPTEKGKGTILGYPVVLDDYIPDGTIIFGDPSYIAYNLPQGITLDSSDHSGYRSGLIDFRAIAIADCKPIVDEAFIKIEAGEGAYNYSSKGQVTIAKD